MTTSEFATKRENRSKWRAFGDEFFSKIFENLLDKILE